MIVYDDIAKDKVVIYDKGIDRIATIGYKMDFDDRNTFTFDHRSGEIFIPKIDWIEPLKVEIDHFLECIENDIPCLTDSKHAEQVVNILSS